MRIINNLIKSQLINHDRYKSATSVSVYLSTQEEVDTITTLERIFSDNKVCYIPMYSKKIDTLKMVRLYSLDDYNLLPVTKWNIKQPKDIHIDQFIDGRRQIIKREEFDPLLGKIRGNKLSGENRFESLHSFLLCFLASKSI